MFFTCASIIRVVQKCNKKTTNNHSKSFPKLVWNPLGKHVPKKYQKSSPNLCSGLPKGPLNPPKVLPKTLLEPPLDLLWWSKFGLESPEEAQGGSKRPQGGPRSPKRFQNPCNSCAKCIKVWCFWDVCKCILKHGLEEMDLQSCNKNQERPAHASTSRDLQAGLSGPLCLYRFRKALEFTEGAGGVLKGVPFRGSN